jgi:hypothetical protein
MVLASQLARKQQAESFPLNPSQYGSASFSPPTPVSYTPTPFLLVAVVTTAG